MNNIQEVVNLWAGYLSTIDDWKSLTEGITPKVSGCGLIYEVPNLIDRPNESFAFSDMRRLKLSEPHKHANGETEIYFVVQGVGKTIVGDKIHDLKPDVCVVTPPDTLHVTLPGKDLVLAVVNTPPFNADNYVASVDDDEVATAISQLSAA